MKTMIKTLAASLTLSTALVAVPAAAQVNAIGVANLDAAVQRSTAWTTAMTQMQTTYKPTIDQLNTRQTALRNELQPLATKLETDAKAVSPRPLPTVGPSGEDWAVVGAR